MQDHIRKRAARVGRHILKTSDTVRQAAEHFGVSKSTIHKDGLRGCRKSTPSFTGK